MSRSAGLDKVIGYLEDEQRRFLNAGTSNMFCDSENCLKTALAIRLAITELKEYRDTYFKKDSQHICVE